jgi:hypothetical protein
MSDKSKLRISFSPLRLILFLAIGCSTMPSATPSATPSTPPSIAPAVEFAFGPNWPPEWSKTGVSPGMRHWFHEGEDKENWQESVGVGAGERGRDSGCDGTPKTGLERLIALWEQECPNVEWNLIEEDENSVLWEWWQPNACSPRPDSPLYRNTGDRAWELRSFNRQSSTSVSSGRSKIRGASGSIWPHLAAFTTAATTEVARLSGGTQR